MCDRSWSGHFSHRWCARGWVSVVLDLCKLTYSFRVVLHYTHTDLPGIGDYQGSCISLFMANFNCFTDTSIKLLSIFFICSHGSCLIVSVTLTGLWIFLGIICHSLWLACFPFVVHLGCLYGAAVKALPFFDLMITVLPQDRKDMQQFRRMWLWRVCS